MKNNDCNRPLNGALSEATDKEITPRRPPEDAGPLHKFWKAGRDSNDRLETLKRENPTALAHGHKDATHKAEAAAVGKNSDTIDKARRVADQYSEEEIIRLDGVVKQHASPFSSTHLIRLLSLEKGAQRDQLTLQAIEKSWSARALQQAVQQAKGGRRKDVGRKPRLPDDPKKLESDLHGLCLRWTRWCKEAGSRIREELQPCLRAATEAVKAVQEATKA